MLAMLTLAGAGAGRCQAAPPDSSAPNTVVHFQIQRGTNGLGGMDVELFDRERPETVRNFLLYVRSGAYSNSFLHRCVAGFVVQGGGFSVTNPLAPAQFSAYQEVTNYGRLTNEFLVGPRLSNTFGTIAMAKVGGDPNSATSQWFFNLGNNTTNLDNQNGGFTVFGRVLDSTNTVDGTNVLRHFNTLGTNTGIVDLSATLGSAFSSLPVAYTNSPNSPRPTTNSELYFVQLSILNDTNQPGLSPPSITLLSPAPDSRFTNQPVILRGTATDDVAVARIVYRVQGGALEIGAGTTNWEIGLNPQPGFTTVTAESIDWDGNRSTNPASVTFFYVAQLALQLDVTGTGHVTGATNGQFLQLGRFYTLTAKPGKGQVFDSWSGSVTSTAPSLTFQVPTNATNFSLMAKFVLNPFTRLAGSYRGLFQATNPPTADNAGFLALSLTKSGKFSGRILHRGAKYTYTGRFDGSGSGFVQGNVGGVSRSLTLRLDTVNSAGLITGSLIGGNGSADVQLERLASRLPASNAPPVGRYTFVIPESATNSPTQLAPGGPGFGIGTVSRNGRLQLQGTLGDGTAFSVSETISHQNRWPLYATLFGGRGAVLGWVTASTNLPGNLDGPLQWFKSADAKVVTYPAGFSNQVSLLGAPYAPPAQGVRVIRLVNGLARLAGANLVVAITNGVTLSTNNAIEVVGANSAALTLGLDLKTGTVRGGFLHPWVGGSNALRGVVFKRGDSIRGQFLDGTQSGSLTLDKAPFLFLATQSVASVTLAGFTAAVQEGGVIRFESDGIITLTNPIAIPFDTALDANGHDVVISGGGATRLFEIATNLGFFATGVTFADGVNLGTNGADGAVPQPGGDGCGAGFLNRGGVLSLTNCVLTNFFVQGGNAGSDTSTNLIPAAGGRGLGAAICSFGGAVTLQGCQLADNLAAGGESSANQAAGIFLPSTGAAAGGAIFSADGPCEVRATTLLRNRARGGGSHLLAPGQFSQAGDASGGALSISGGLLTLSSSECRSNSAVALGAPTNSPAGGNARGGALLLETNAQARIDQTVFADNLASGGDSAATTEAGDGAGGAICSSGTLQLRNCTLERNTVQGGASVPAGSGSGGAVASFGPLVLDACTLNDNLALGGAGVDSETNRLSGAQGSGGAIYAVTSSFSATNSTLAFNRAAGGPGAAGVVADVPPGDGRGGALALVSNTVSLVHVTLAFNRAEPGLATGTNANLAAGFGGGIANLAAVLTLRASILASNAPKNAAGGLSDGGYNVSTDDGLLAVGTGSLTNVDPLLGPLTTNGGPTRTMAISPTSPARDLLPTNGPALVDQRGTARPPTARSDSGAFELVLSQTLPSFTVAPTGGVVRVGSTFTLRVVAVGAAPLGYFWLKNGALFPNATNATLALVSVQPADAGDYAAVATNSYGAVTSTVATVTVTSDPQVLVQPNDLSLGPGGSGIFSVTATGPSLSYLWLHNGVPVAGGTNAVLAVNNALAGAQGTYQVIITNIAGTTNSRLASLTFNASALNIITPPQSITSTQGYPAVFNVLVSGVPPFRYQWQVGTALLPDATNDTLAFASLDLTNAGTYRVLVSNAYASITSAPATLTVDLVPPVPRFVVEPQGASLRAGTNVNLQALAIGLPPLGYFWIKDGNPLLGATNTVLALTNVQAADAGVYAAVATNSFGVATSLVATVTVDSTPSLVAQPSDLVLAPAGSGSFVFTVSGPALEYLWLHDGLPLAGRTNAALVITNASGGAQGFYQAIVTNFAGAVTSRLARLAFDASALSIRTDPESLTVTQGQVATFSVLVSGIPAFAYQWLYGTAALADATNDALVFPSADPTNAGSYRVVVTNAYASLTSAPAVLTIVASPLSITTQPQSLSVTQGQAATFDVVVSGIPPFHYQWWLDTAELLDATNSTLSFVSTDQTIQGTYRVVITNAYLAVTSAPAALVVTAPSPLAASQPVLTLTLAAQGAELLVTCRGAPGQVYHVLSTTRLDAHAAWETVATNTLPAAGMMTWARPRPTNGAVYFRATLP